MNKEEKCGICQKIVLMNMRYTNCDTCSCTFDDKCIYSKAVSLNEDPNGFIIDCPKCKTKLYARYNKNIAKYDSDNISYLIFLLFFTQNMMYYSYYICFLISCVFIFLQLWKFNNFRKGHTDFELVNIKSLK